MLLLCLFLETSDDILKIDPQFGGFWLICALSASLVFGAFHSLTLKELLAGCCKRSPNFDRHWAELYRRYDRHIIKYVHRALRKNGVQDAKGYEDLVHDLTQDIYWLLIKEEMKAIRSFKGDTEIIFLGYLRMISVRHVQNVLRKQNHRSDLLKKARLDKSNVTIDDNEPQFFTNATEDDLTHSAVLTHIVKALLDYPSKNRERDIAIFILQVLAEMDSNDICCKFNFGLSASGVATLVSRMKQYLKDNY